MRAPGFFQGIFFADQVFEHVAQVFGKFLEGFLILPLFDFFLIFFWQVLNVNPDDLKRKNFYQKGDVTPYNESLGINLKIFEEP